MSSCNVSFFKDTDGTKGTGDSKNYDGPQSESDLHDVHWPGKSHNDMEDDISWIDTSSGTWVRIFSRPNFLGRTALIGPDAHLNLKYVQDDKNEGNMDNTIESFQIYDHNPGVNTTNIINNFVALYPGSKRGRKNDLYESEWYAQNSEYRVYDPSIELKGSTIFFSVKLDHIQLESDDHALLTFSMDPDGGFVDKIQVTYDIASATQIPDWVIKIIDGAIDVAKLGAIAIADGAEIILTDGVGVVAVVETNKIIKYTAEALTFCVDHLNTVLGAAFKFQDDGGTTNFTAIVSHCIARLILAYYQELYGPDTNTPLSFNIQKFLGGFGTNNWSDDGSKNNPTVKFEHNGHDYRTYYPDNSFFYARGGAVSSAKVSALNTAQKDDHLVLQTVLDPKGNLFSVAGCMDIFLLKSVSGYTAPASGVLTYNADRKMIHIAAGTQEVTVLNNYSSLEAAYSSMMTNALNNTAKEFDINLSDHQSDLVSASVQVLQAMNAAIQ